MNPFLNFKGGPLNWEEGRSFSHQEHGHATEEVARLMMLLRSLIERMSVPTCLTELVWPLTDVDSANRERLLSVGPGYRKRPSAIV